MEVIIDEKKGTMTITMPLLKEPRESGSGKTMVIASTGGNQLTEAKYKGSPITVGLNAYFKNPNFKKGPKGRGRGGDDDDAE